MLAVAAEVAIVVEAVVGAVDVCVDFDLSSHKEN
jgi:hypothetical protein